MEEITATKDEIQEAFDLWYTEYGVHPENFDGELYNAAETLIEYLNVVKGVVPK